MIDFLIDPWTWGDWMWRGVLAGSLVSLICAPLGVVLYLRRMSMVVDALAHVALPGIVIAFLLSGSIDWWAMLLGAAFVGIAASVSIEGLTRLRHVRSDSAIGIVLTAFFAIGVILLTTSVHSAHIDTDCVLFGNILAISDHTLVTLSVAVPLVLGALFVFWRWLVLSTFDASMAATLGLPVVAIHHALMGGVSLASVASFEAVGAVLVIAFFIIPAATAHLLAESMRQMVLTAVGVSLASVWIGMYASIALNCSTAGAIVVVLGLIYLGAFLFSPKYGRAWKRGRGQVFTPSSVAH